MDDGDGGHSSDIDPESEDSQPHYEPRSPFPGIIGYIASPTSHQHPRSPPFPIPDYLESPTQTIERLQNEIAEAKAEAARAQAALHKAEAGMEEEARMKRQALKLADDEAARRLLAEEQLRLIKMSWSPRTPTPSPSPSPSPQPH